MGHWWATEGTKTEHVRQVRNHSNVLLNFMKSHQDITFSTRTQDGAPSGKQRTENWKRLARTKTLTTFIEFYRIQSRFQFFRQGPEWESQKQPRWQKRKRVASIKIFNDFFMNYVSFFQDLTFPTRIQNGTPRNSCKNENGKCLMSKKTKTAFIQVLWILVSITFLRQRSRRGPKGVARGANMETSWWIKNHKRSLFEFCKNLPGSHFCRKDAWWDPKGQPKEPKWEMSDRPKTWASVIWILWILARITLLPQGSRMASQGTTEEAKMENVWWRKNISDLYLSFAHTSHDHTFTTRINDGIPKKRQRIENGKCSMGKKIKDFWLNFANT